MSRIGKLPISIPGEVTLTQKDSDLTTTGPKGMVNLTVPEGLTLVIKDQVATLTGDEDIEHIRGMFRTLVQNAVTGVISGWEKNLELVGVGYRASGGGNELVLTVGFSHPVKITAPKDITFKVLENTRIVVSGIDKKVVGEVAAQIRAIKPPEPYKGKGIRYLGEVVRRKAGKVVKAAGAAV